MNQKEALKNILAGMRHDLKRQFICNWLEDINWHTEHRLLAEQEPVRAPRVLEWLERMTYAENPAGYGYEYTMQRIAEISQEDLQLLMDIKRGKETLMLDMQVIDRQTLHEWRRVETWYQPFNYIFGWGINNNSWTSGGSGQAFVDELKEIINNE